MPLGQDKTMPFGERVDVEDGKGKGIFAHLVTRRLPFHHTAENAFFIAIAHELIPFRSCARFCNRSAATSS
jgi:hypothetical protein